MSKEEISLDTVRKTVEWMVRNINTECLHESETTRLDQIANDCWEELIKGKIK